MKRSVAAAAVLVFATSLTAACGSPGKPAANATPSLSMSQQMSMDPSMPMPSTAPPSGSGGSVPDVIGSGPALGDVYAADQRRDVPAGDPGGALPALRPNHSGGTVSVIDPIAKKVIATFPSAPAPST